MKRVGISIVTEKGLIIVNPGSNIGGISVTVVEGNKAATADISTKSTCDLIKVIEETRDRK